MSLNNHFLTLGMMSGTSLDGLDLVLCRFSLQDETWNYQIVKADTIPYDSEMKNLLASLPELSALDYFYAQRDFSTWVGSQINHFLINEVEKPMLIASHGHTVFHRPEEALTVQMGSGAVIAAHTGITTIADFRTTDVALGGQGAPLVPIGDKLLFANYDACLNLGGISNISFDLDDQRVAFDISLCNIALNYLANHCQLPYDKDGEMAKSGTLNEELLHKMNNFPYFYQPYPKSLGREWFESNFKPILDDSTLPIPDLMRTVTEHIAQQITKVIPKNAQSILVTGGGAKNIFLIDLLKNYTKTKVIIPDEYTISYKEAIIFAFLGLLRIQNKNNVLKEVTGAKKCSCSGAVYMM